MSFYFDKGVKVLEFSIVQMAIMTISGKKRSEWMLLVEAVENDSATYRRVGFASCWDLSTVWPEERRVITII